MLTIVRRALPFLTVLVLFALAFSLAPTAEAAPKNVDVQVLAVNDFHGALDPNKGNGGAEYLATYLKNYAAMNPNTVKVSAGDTIGASPLLSALFHDEATIMAFNQMGFDFAAGGNHEFDEGWKELLRIQKGGCHPTDGCYSGVPKFTGAKFQFLTANVVRLDIHRTLFSAYAVRKFQGVKVAFIGVSLESTPTIVVPSGVASLQFKAEVAAINSAVRTLKQFQGIRAFVALLHDGAGPAANPNACNRNDPFVSSVVMHIDPEVDALITGHTHNAYNCQVTLKK
jgi:5'-nucleotidase